MSSTGEPGTCHSLVVRLPAGAGRERVEAWCAAAGRSDPVFGPLRIWHEDTRRPRCDPRTAQLLRREAARELWPGGPALRVTLIHHADGGCDAVLVADRCVFSHAALTRIATAMRGNEPELAPLIAENCPARRVRRHVEWGLPDPGEAHGRVRLEFAQEPKLCASLVPVAAALILSRYDGAACAHLATEAGVITVAVDEDETVGEFLHRVEQASGRPGGESAAVEVLRTAHDPDLSYLPGVAARFPLTLHIETEGEAAVAGFCHYDASAVGSLVARGFARHVIHVATELASSAPERPLSQIETMPASATAAVLAAGCTPTPVTTGPGPIRAETTLHAAFRDLAGRFPNHPAVCDAERVLTYRELELEAERKALGLLALGVRPGDFVGVCVERTCELVVTLLAVLMADAAYVPMDPHNPADRLRFIAEDAGLRLVIADEGCFPDPRAVAVVTPATLTLGAPLVDHAARPVAATADDPAYVIYTSGSTGRPKGVVVPHRNVAALVAAVGEYELRESDVWTLFHASSFDFSVWEIWGCLLTGGRLVVVPQLVARSPAEFRALLARERVTVLSQTPSAFANLLEADARGEGELALRLVVFGGEPLDVALLGPWFARHPPADCRVVNMFGITETTVHVTAKTVTPADIRIRSRSVGRALPGWSVSVRDPRGRPVPPGVPGEIYVGGAGVAIGYLARDELTRQRFMDDPYGGGRLYRSGDRGLMRPDGCLDHLGRLDSQVKIRGFRIELDEIRTVLQEDPMVETAAVQVIAHESDSADLRIVAYVTLHGGLRGPSRETVAGIRRRIAGLLPDYMLPASITPLAELPLTANAKLDTARLPTPHGDAPSAGDPRSGEETCDTVLRVWRQILAQPIEPDDDFFEHGGNSLLAIRVLSGVAATGLPRAAVRDLYRVRTAARLAALLDERGAHAHAQPLDARTG